MGLKVLYLVLLFLCAVLFLASIFQHFFFFQKTILLCIPDKSPGAPVSIDLSKFIALLTFFPSIVCRHYWRNLWFGNYFVRYPKCMNAMDSFNLINYSYYWKYLQSIAELENVKLHITVSDSGIIFISCRIISN